MGFVESCCGSLERYLAKESFLLRLGPIRTLILELGGRCVGMTRTIVRSGCRHCVDADVLGDCGHSPYTQLKESERVPADESRVGKRMI